jgi:hypothetical protein
MTLVCKWRTIVLYGLGEVLALIGVFVKIKRRIWSGGLQVSCNVIALIPKHHVFLFYIAAWKNYSFVYDLLWYL